MIEEQQQAVGLLDKRDANVQQRLQAAISTTATNVEQAIGCVEFTTSDSVAESSICRDCKYKIQHITSKR